MRRMSRVRHGGLAVVALLALTLLLSGCGGTDDSSSTTGPADMASGRPAERLGDGAGEARAEKKGAESGETAGDAGSEKPQRKAEESGSEATGSEAERAEAALLGYLEARAHGQWQRACSYFGKELRARYRQFARAAEGDLHSCGEYIARVTLELTPSERASLPDIDVRFVRLDGANGRIVYVDGSGMKTTRQVRREAGSWKLSSLFIHVLERARHLSQ